jgi:fibronectin type 3 domain-containing protein
MKKILLILLISASLANIAEAQIRQDLITMAAGDSVVLFLTDPPGSNESFLVYRQGPLPTNNDFVLLTKDEPVKPTIDANQVKTVLGPDWEVISKAFGTDEPFEVLRRLRGDEFIGIVHSLYSPQVARLTGRLYIDKGVEPGKEYRYKISVINNRGDERYSLTEKVIVTEIYPQPPTDLKAETGDGSIKLTWKYPPWAGSYKDLAIQYYLYRKVGDGDFAKVDHKPIIRDDYTPSEYNDLWLKNGAEYSYYVIAVDPIGRQSQPSPTITAIPVDKTPPAIPENLNVESGDGVVAMAWNMSLELDVAGYYVYRSIGLDKEFIKLNDVLVPVNIPVYFDSTIANGVQYFYSITAVDKSGNESERGNPIATIGEDKTPPDAPKNLTYKITNRILKLTWSASKAKDVAGYYIYRGMDKDVQPKINHEPFADTVFADSGYQAEGMTPGKNFWVSITAADRSRNESEKITLEIAIPDDEPPLAPQGFVAENVEGRYVRISCNGSASLDVAAYKIHRAEKGGAFQVIKEFNHAPFVLNDSMVSKGTANIYYAVAYDSAGNKSGLSQIDTVFIKDYSAPPSPRNCTARVTPTGIQLKWERVVDFDLKGYNVYRSTIPSGVYEKLNNEPLTKLEFIDKAGTVKHYYKIKAVDSSGNESDRGEAVHAG